MDAVRTKLSEIEKQYKEIVEKLMDEKVMSDPKLLTKLSKEQARLTQPVEAYHQLLELDSRITQADEMLKENDPELKEMARMEKDECEPEREVLLERIQHLLVPRDPDDDHDVIMEIRGGAGGDEAALFAADLFRMYSRYAERKKWKIEIIEKQDGELGGIKEIAFTIIGLGAYSRLKFESGVHRVQRVPKTEASGRIHTSTATVAVLPEVEDVQEVTVDPKDLKIDTYRSGGAGGQHVNMTDSAVRITHLPTGIVVQCQDERSQLKNREKAMKHLLTKLYEMEQEKQRSEVESERRLQVGTGDRAEKIRTYNFPDGRITDHRIKLTVHQLEAFLDGDIDEMIDALITFHQAELLSASEQ